MSEDRWVFLHDQVATEKVVSLHWILSAGRHIRDNGYNINLIVLFNCLTILRHQQSKDKNERRVPRRWQNAHQSHHF